ncbi:unnamed protein product, partial [Staurois parvus]
SCVQSQLITDHQSTDDQCSPSSATCQCPVPCASQCHLSVPCISAAFQCPSVMPVNAHHCHLPVPPHQCPSLQPH